MLPETAELIQYCKRFDELDAEETKLLQQHGVRSPPYDWRKGPVDRSLTGHDDIDPQEAHLFGAGIGMGPTLRPASELDSKLRVLEEQYEELLQDIERQNERDEHEHLIFFKLFDPAASPNNIR